MAVYSVFSDMRTNLTEAEVSLEGGVVLCREVDGSVISFRCVSGLLGTHNSSLPQCYSRAVLFSFVSRAGSGMIFSLMLLGNKHEMNFFY